MSKNYFGLIVSAGTSRRFNDPQSATLRRPKQYQKIAKLPVIVYSIKVLAQISKIKEIHIVVSTDDNYFISEFSGFLEKIPKPVYIHNCGGETRSDSVVNGLAKINSSNSSDMVLVHDAARPCVRSKDIQKLINNCMEDENIVGGLLAVKITDTIKRSKTRFVEQTIDRDLLWQSQTPQMFSIADLIQGYFLAKNATDEASAIENLLANQKNDKKILIVEGSRTNIKITYPEDLLLAKYILENN